MCIKLQNISAKILDPVNIKFILCVQTHKMGLKYRIFKMNSYSIVSILFDTLASTTTCYAIFCAQKQSEKNN